MRISNPPAPPKTAQVKPSPVEKLLVPPTVTSCKASVAAGEMLTAAEVASRLKVKPRTVNGWRQRKLLPDDAWHKSPTRLVRYNWTKVEKWWLENRSS